jgi:autotransporter translocation and assembly factor TamB
MKRLALVLVIALGLLAALGGAGLLWLRSEGGKAWLAAEIARQVSTPGEMQVAIGRLDGDLFSRIELFDVAASDAGGVWMSVGSAKVDWQPFDLLRGSLTLDRVEIRHAALQRLPEAVPTEKEPTLAEQLDALRALPAIRIAGLSIEDLTLGEAVLGQRAVLRATGRVDTEAAAQVRGGLSVQRVDGGTGSLALKGEYRALDDWLALDVALSEPSGGLIARALDIPGLPPLQAEGKGSGALADWRGTIALSFERAASLNADVSVRHGKTTGFGIAGAATIPTGNGNLLRHIVSGAHKFRVEGTYGPEDVVSLSQASWTAPDLNLAASGNLALEDLALDARVSLWTTANTPLRLAPDGATVGALSAEATASGRLPAPELRLNFDADKVFIPNVLTANADGILAFKPDSRESGRIDGTVALNGVAWAGEPLLQSLLGSEVALQVGAAVDDRRSELRVESAHLNTPSGHLSGSGLFNWSSGDGTVKATLAVPDLAPFRPAIGVPLSGRADVSLDAAMRAFGASATAALSGKAAGMTLGSALADAVLARDADIGATLSLADGKVAVKQVVAKSGAFEAQLDGTLDTTSRAVAGTYRVDIGGGKPILVADGVAAECACRASGKVQGTLDSLGMTGDAALRSLRLQNVALRTLTAEYDAAKLTGDPSGSIRLKAATPVGDASAQAKYAFERDRLRLKDLQANAGTARLRGTLDLPLTDAPVAGDLAIGIARLQPWLAAAGMEGEGKADAQIKMRAEGKRQAIDGTAKITGLSFRTGPEAAPIAAELVTLDATTRDLLAGSGNKIDVGIDKGSMGAAKLQRIAATAQGSLAQAKLSLSAKGDWNGPLAVDAAADYAEKAGRRSLDLATLQATAAGIKIALRQPLRIAWSDAELRADGLALDVGEARLTGAIRTGERDADIALDVARVPLKLIDRFTPLGLDGQAEASLSLKGAWPEPQGKLSLAIPRLRFKGEPDAPTMKVVLDGDWRSGRLTLDGKIDAGRGAPSVVEGSFPLRLDGPTWNFSMPRQQPVSGSLRWSGETATLWRFVPLSEHLLRGPGKVDIKLVGTLAQPALEGSVSLARGYYESLEFGTVLRALNLDIAFEGRQLRIARLTANDGGEGKLVGSGQVALDPDGGFPFDLSARLDKLTVIRRDDVQASASGTAKLNGSASKAKIQSDITTDQVEIRVLDRLPPEVASLDVVEIGRGGKLPPPRKTEAAVAPTPFDLELGIQIAMPRRVFVRGRGIDSEWKGNIRVGGTANKPAIAGYLALVRGQMTVVGKTFHLEDGSVFLPETGEGEPEISVSAVYSARDLTVRAEVEGPVSTPEVTLTSTPAMPKEEIVSHVLFNKSSSNLSVYEAAQLGLALAELTGQGGGGGVMDFVRKTIGVDSLQIESTETSKGTVPVVGAGKYLTDDVYVGVKQGATPESSSVGVEVEVLPNISVESEVRRSGASDVGVKFKLDY